MQMTPLFWLYAGVALILFEIMTPGLVTLFFGLAALTIALLTWLLPGISQVWQWLGFSLLSIVYIGLLRRGLKKIFSGVRRVSDDPADDYTGKTAIVAEAIAPHKPGRVEFGGTTWAAESSQELAPGATVRIAGRRNLTLAVERYE